MRLLPHHQDTGGFFVAVLCKKSVLPWEKQKEEKVALEEKAGDSKEASK